MAFQSHSYPYQMGTPPSNPAGSPQRFQNPQAAVRPPRPVAGPGQAPQQVQGSQGITSSKFPLLQYMTTEQLQALLDNEDQQKEMVEDVDDIKQKKLDKEMALAENRSLADFNLSREPRLREGRAQLARLHQEARGVRDVYDTDRRKLEGLPGGMSATEAKVMLETAAEKAEEESEELADKFIQGEFTTELFLEQFQELRRIAHVRRIKADKVEELQRNGHITSLTSGPSESALNSYPGTSATNENLQHRYAHANATGGALPYPAPGAPQQGSPYSSPARIAPRPPTYQAAGSAVGYSAPTQNQAWRPYGPPSGNMAMPTLGSYPQ